ncbi:MAG TPA: O-antigen ligase family protein [Candidatus Saccharimonadales bacterium]|nr:O-antigen ligase family protein [Candidatus Saccharimonadales bacterium]
MLRIYILSLVIIFIGIVFHAPLSVGLGVLFPDYDLLIKSWKEIVMVLLIPLAVVIVTRQKLWRTLLSDWLFRFIAFYGVIHVLLSIVMWQGVTPTLAGLAIDLRYVLFFGLIYVAIRAMPQARQLLVIAATIGAFVVVGFATLQLFLPPDILAHIGYSKQTIAPYLTVDENPDYIRVNSTLRGPNPLGAYAGMVLGFLTAAWIRGKLQLKSKKVLAGTLILAICSIIALWISYSRSALVAGIVAVFVALLLTQAHKVTKRVWIAAGIILLVLVGGLIAARETPFVANVILHDNQESGGAVSSNEDHMTSLQYGFERLFQEPFGVGVGSTGSASLLGSSPVIIENQYLFIGHETGWLGLALFLILFVIIMKRLWRLREDWLSLGAFASGIGLALIGILLPVWTDDTVSIIWWGLAAVAIAGGDYARHATK